MLTTRSLAIRGTSYPLILPTIRDPRLHVAAVIISIHVLGQLGLDFAVSIPQILAAMTIVHNWMQNPAWVNGGFGNVQTIAATTFQNADTRRDLSGSERFMEPDSNKAPGPDQTED